MTQMAIPLNPPVTCERCRSRPAVHTHHRQRRSQGGDNSPENLVKLCLDCHVWVHDNPKDAAAAGWLVLSWQEPIEIEPVVVDVRGGREHDHITPGQVCPACGRKVPVKREKPETPRNRVVVSFKVPVDVDEDGVALWDEMIELGRELLCPRMGWAEDVPVYNVAMVLVSQGLEAVRSQPEQADA